VKAVRSGAFDYLSKPFELGELDLVVRQALRTLDLEKVEQFQNYRSERESEENVLVGDSAQIAEVQRLISLAANADAPVLVTGETGSGKNVVARSIHYRGPRRHAPFISINCAALPETLIEAELFGHEKGAFTGAVSTKKGMFEMAGERCFDDRRDACTAQAKPLVFLMTAPSGGSVGLYSSGAGQVLLPRG
jgi:DNA-binding NtrC family response regulator